MAELTNSLPYFTADLPGIGGRIKDQPDDFIVEEIPAYEPSGEGQHLFLWTEKRDLPHDLMMRKISRTLDISPNDIGFAGIKDRRAVTRQYVSVPINCGPAVEKLGPEGLTILRSAAHGNKLRTGHLRGNRFRILVRGVQPEAFPRVEQMTERIRQSGFPNYYGEQRFGLDGETLKLGLDLLSGTRKPQEIPFAKRKFLLRLALSSVQSDLFNKSLGQRLQEGLLRSVLDGDILEVTESGGKFITDDVSREQARLDRGEVAITGPMFGVKMLTPSGAAREREEKLLQESGLKLEDFQQYANLLAGTRRAYFVVPGEIQTTPTEDGVRFEFSLPSGVYATVLLREFMKSDSLADAE